MAAAGGSGSRSGLGRSGEDEAVADLLDKLNLTHEEADVAALSDDEDGDEGVQCAAIGKVLSPSTVHISTAESAMRPAWGNPYRLKFRSVGDKAENLFIVEFGDLADKQQALDGSPWMVVCHAVVI
ncbi:unnamed protein product [Urochloa humidicola]